jgi:hypothetical protein
MNTTKTIVLLVAASLVILAAVGVAYAQIVNSQNIQNQTQLQATNGAYGYGYYVPSNNGTYAFYPCYPYGAAAQAGPSTPQTPVPQAPYQYSGRMGMCGRFW